MNLAGDGRYDELIKRLSGHLDLVFSKCNDKGENICTAVAADPNALQPLLPLSAAGTLSAMSLTFACMPIASLSTAW